MKTLRFLLVPALVAATAFAQQAQKPTPSQPEPPGATQPAQAEDISGMYSFLREGEFVQVFSKASLKDKHLAFTTKPIHGVWFDFDGNVERGPGKTPHDEGYRVIRGTLTQTTEDMNKKNSSKSRQVEFKSFPQDLDRDTQKKP